MIAGITIGTLTKLGVAVHIADFGGDSMSIPDPNFGPVDCGGQVMGIGRSCSWNWNPQLDLWTRQTLFAGLQ